MQIPNLWPVTCHTDHVSKNGIFVVIKGQKYNGADYIPLALQKGAVKIVADVTEDISIEMQEAIKKAEAQLIFVENPRRKLAFLAAQSWSHPADLLKILAITGTKGKTTTAWLLYHLMRSAGYSVALLSTVKNKINDLEFPTELTTQQPDYLHAFFHACAREKVEYVIMEVAAQAVTLHRTAGLQFDGIIFTNFAPAHGEFYITPDEYYKAKHDLFAQLKTGAAAVINQDDNKGTLLLNEYAHARSFGIHPAAHTALQSYRTDVNGISGTILCDGISQFFSCPGLTGEFNAYNILAAVSMAVECGISWKSIISALETFKGVPGRLERYSLPNGASCFIDYAHNPLSFEAVLSLLGSMTDHLIVVAGAGGEREKAMRPLLGNIMAAHADMVILTTDNPRSENPADIIASMYAGISPEHHTKVVCELDRQEAIKEAYRYATPTSIIALLGKGPEQYQIIGLEKQFFSERAIVQSLL